MKKNKPIITSYSNSDWKIPLEDLMKTVLSSVAFYVYDEHRMNDIMAKLSRDLEAAYGVDVKFSIQFNQPTIYVINDSF